jgi:putative membrane protein insertion efficiency factor
MRAKFLPMGLIRAYQIVIAPILPPACRFDPSCSEYMRQAIDKFGVARGAYLGAKRILRCHPWHPGGADPVP